MYKTIYIQIFQEIVYAWNMYIYNKVTNVLMSLGFLATLIFRRLATRYEFFRVKVIRALRIYDLLPKKSWQYLLNYFDLVTSQDLLLSPFNLQIQWKQKYEYIYCWRSLNSKSNHQLLHKLSWNESQTIVVGFDSNKFHEFWCSPMFCRNI